MLSQMKKAILAFVCVFAILSSLLITFNVFTVSDSKDNFINDLSAIYSEYSPSPDSVDENNPYALKRLCVYEFSGKKYGAKAVAYDKKNDFAVLQYETEEDAKKAYFELEKDGAIVEFDSIAKPAETEKGTLHPDESNAVGTTSYINNINMPTEEIIVAIVDTGVMYDHEAIADRFYSHGTDLTSDECYDAYYDTLLQGDFYGHATAVCGIIADNTPDNVKIQPYKVMPFGESTTFTSTIIAGMNTAVSEGASVVNVSMSSIKDEFLFQVAVNNAVKKGVCVCASLGNNAKETTEYFPACCNGTFCVSALENDFSTIASFSNYGEKVDFTAPGRRIHTAYPSQEGASYALMSGTSFSTPFISALCCNLKSIKKDLSRDDIYNILADNSVDLGDEGRDKYFGYGLPDISNIVYTDNSTYSYSIPKGVLDVTKSVNYEKNSAPWSKFAENMVRVNIDSGITDIGSYMFYNMKNAEFSMPETFDSVGEGAFYNCSKIKSAKFNIDVKNIGNYAYAGIDGIVISGYRNTPCEDYCLRDNIKFRKLGCKHEYVYEVYEPTENREGYTLYTCLICNDTFMGAYKPSRLLASGSCGDNLTYSIYENGRLVIDGTGEMKNYFGLRSPFKDYADVIKVVEIGKDVSFVSPFAFYSCNNITKIKVHKDNEYFKSDSTALLSKDGTKLILLASKGRYVMDDEVSDVSATAFICAANTVVTPNDNYYIEDYILYDGNGDIVVAFSNYNERVLKIDRKIRIHEYAFMFISYPEVVDTKQINVVAEKYSLGFKYNFGVTRHSMLFKIGSVSKLNMYAVNNGFDIEYYDLGTAGDDISWYYNADEEALYFEGTGEMTTYEDAQSVPWYDYIIDVKKVVIDDRITTLSPYAFYGATSLEELTMPLSVKAFSDDTVFDGVYYLKTLNLTHGSGYSDDYVTEDGTHLYRNTPWYMSRKTITSFNLDEDVKYIGKEMFRNSLFISSLTFNCIEEIGEDAFIACTNLTQVTNYSKNAVLNPYCLFSYNISGKHGIYVNKTIYGYDDSTSKDYCSSNSVNFISLGCAHSRNVSEVSRASTQCCRAEISYRCNDCNALYTLIGNDGEGHSVNIHLVTTTNYVLSGAEIEVGGYSGVTDSEGNVTLSGVYCGDYILKVSLHGKEIYSTTVTVDGGDVNMTAEIQYADYVRDGVINAKDYAYSLKHGFNDTELYDWSIESEN